MHLHSATPGDSFVINERYTRAPMAGSVVWRITSVRSNDASVTRGGFLDGGISWNINDGFTASPSKPTKARKTASMVKDDDDESADDHAPCQRRHLRDPTLRDQCLQGLSFLVAIRP